MSLPILQFGVWIRALGDRVLAAILRVSVEETAAELTQATIAAKRRTIETAIEAIDYANSVHSAGDDLKDKLLTAFKADIGDITAIGREVFSGTISPEVGQETLGNAPFGSAPSGTVSANKPFVPLPRPEPMDPPSRSEEVGPTSNPTPRRRGRPPKHPRPEATS